jgi:hypothetical protein
MTFSDEIEQIDSCRVYHSGEVSFFALLRGISVGSMRMLTDPTSELCLRTRRSHGQPDAAMESARYQPASSG